MRLNEDFSKGYYLALVARGVIPLVAAPYSREGVGRNAPRKIVAAVFFTLA